MMKTILVCLCVSLIVNHKLKDDDLKYNVYDEPLERCLLPDDPQAWGDAKCNEPGGGVHQICFIEIGVNSNQFSKNTGQPNWSDERGRNNHCVCLGAWSLYVAKRNKGEIQEDQGIKDNNKLKCDAIPRIALTKRYIYTWSTWNGLQLPNQIMDGVKGLRDECVKFAKGDSKRIDALDKHYSAFMDEIKDSIKRKA